MNVDLDDTGRHRGYSWIVVPLAVLCTLAAALIGAALFGGGEPKARLLLGALIGLAASVIVVTTIRLR